MWRVAVLTCAATSACAFHSGKAGGDGGPIGGDGSGSQADAPGDGIGPDTSAITARMKIVTIPASSVTGIESGFPTWFVLDNDADLRAHALANGSDIYFTLPDHTLLDYQIQSWDKAAGHLEAWVKLDLSAGAATTFDLRYGDASVAQPSDPAAVFTSNFLSVWHLDDTLASTQVADTRGAQMGTAIGGLGTTGHVAGKLGSGIRFDGTSNEITFTNQWTGGGSHTVSAWVNVTAPASGFASILTVGNSQTNQSRWFHTNYGGVSCGFFGNDWTTSGVNINGAGWTLIDYAYDSNTRVGTLYQNGTLVATSPAFATGVATAGNGGHIGNAPMPWGPGGNTTNPLNGMLDELRIATTARTASWIKTEYANQNAPGSFYTVGMDQPAS